MTYSLTLDIIDEPHSVTIRCESPSAAELNGTVCDWIASGLVPIEVLDGTVWLLPSSAIDRFGIETADETRT